MPINEENSVEAAPPSRGSLLVIFLTVFIDLLGFGMVLPLLPIYAKSFGGKEAGWEIGLLMSSFSAMTFIFAPLWGRASDRVGRRPVLIVGLIGSVFFYILFGVATVFQSMTLLFVARAAFRLRAVTSSTYVKSRDCSPSLKIVGACLSRIAFMKRESTPEYGLD